MRTLLISGSSRGIGLALARHYAEAGWHVAGLARSEAGFEHANYTHWQVNLTDEAAVVQSVKDVKKQLGSIDALLNNAALAGMNQLLTATYDSFQNMMLTNAGGTFLLIREVGKQMVRQNGGRIVNLTSVSVPLSLETQAAYAASKSAVEMLTRIAARELAPFHITVNALGPTPMDMGLANGIKHEWQQNVLNMQSIKSKAGIDDIIHSLDYFLSPQAGMVTGQVLYLGGVW